jgi:hypothetical protein
MNKHERIKSRKKKAAQLAKKCGWTESFNELPEKTRKAFLSKGEIRIQQPKKSLKMAWFIC